MADKKTALELDMEKMEQSLEEPSVIEEPIKEPETPPEEPPAEPPVETPPVEVPPEVPPVEPPPPEEDPRDKAIRELRAEIDELKKPKEPPKETSKEPEAPKDEPLADEDFLGEVDLSELTNDPKLFNSVLNKIYKKGHDAGLTKTRAEIKREMENVIKAIPDIVKNNIAIMAKLKEANEKFYKDNPDLVPWKTSVATVFGEVANSNMDKNYDQLLPLVAEETRKRLGLKKEVNNNTKPNNPPNLPNVKGGPRPSNKPDSSQFEKELDAMDKALDN